MKIDSMKVGETWELDLSDKDGNHVIAKFKIIENSWYPSNVKPGFFFHGIKCRFENGAEEILPFISAEFARKVC
jgi:hypothetical protein